MPKTKLLNILIILFLVSFLFFLSLLIKFPINQIETENITVYQNESNYVLEDVKYKLEKELEEDAYGPMGCVRKAIFELENLEREYECFNYTVFLTGEVFGKCFDNQKKEVCINGGETRRFTEALAYGTCLPRDSNRIGCDDKKFKKVELNVDILAKKKLKEKIKVISLIEERPKIIKVQKTIWEIIL